MKQWFSIFALSAVLAILFASCAPQPGSSSNPGSGANPNGTPGVQSAALVPPQVGTTMLWVDGSTLIFVPAGDFIMGTNGGKDNPQHTVTLDAFWIYQSKVTNREYSLCVDIGKCQPPIDPQAAKDLSDPTLLDHPVVGVNWSQSQTYCGWVQGRLPTEAEWEKTGRGPNGNTYPWGSAPPDGSLLNFNDNIGATSNVTDFTKGQSFYTGFDLEGNVFEWVADWYQADYYATSPQKNPAGPAAGDARSMRSSSFSSTSDQAAAYTRFSFAPDKTRPDLGFRCVVDQPAAFAPYCQTSQVAGPPTCKPPTVTSQSVCRGGTGVGVAKLNGGAIQSVKANPPLNCSYQGQTLICTGPQSTTGKVTVCTQGCAGTLSCPAGYHPVVRRDGSPTCESDALCASGASGSAGCGQNGSISNGINNIAPATCGGTTGRPCPRPTDVPTPATNAIAGTGPIAQVGCPLGSYLDKASGSCVRLGGTPNQCLPGYVFNQGCCQVPTGSGGRYPGCGPNEYLDPLTGGCMAAGGPGPGNCTSISITTGACSTSSGGGPNGGGTCQEPTGGCPAGTHWQDCQCEGTK